MNCVICHTKNPGNHNKESCCRACAAFFRRTMQNKLRYRCKADGECQINTEKRYFCRYCRLKRCIDVGMTNNEDPDIPMSFFLDNLNTADETSCSDQSKSNSVEIDDFYDEENIFNNYDNFVVEHKQRLRGILSKPGLRKESSISLTLHQSATLAFDSHRTKWPNCTADRIVYTEVVDLNADFCDCLKAVQYAAEFCMDIPQFAQLELDLKCKLMQQFFSPFMHFERMFVAIELLGNDLYDTRSVYYNGQVADCRDTEVDTSKISLFPEDKIRGMIHEEEDAFLCVFTEFKRVNPDQIELMYLLLASLWSLKNSDAFSPKETKILHHMQERISQELFMYYVYEKNMENFASRVYKLSNLLTSIDRLDELWTQNGQIADTFDLFHYDVHLERLSIA